VLLSFSEHSPVDCQEAQGQAEGLNIVSGCSSAHSKHDEHRRRRMNKSKFKVVVAGAIVLGLVAALIIEHQMWKTLNDDMRSLRSEMQNGNGNGTGFDGE
jgi:hypothetical protein